MTTNNAINTPILGTIATQNANNVNITGGTLNGIKLQDYTEITTYANSGASYALNLNNGNVFSLTLTANCALSITNVPVSNTTSLTLELIQDGVGSRTVTWPGSIVWSAGSAPTLRTAVSSVDIVVMITFDGGTTWYASYVNPVASAALTNGQLFIGDTGNPPVASTLTAGTGINITNGAGSITIAATATGTTWNDTTGTSATLAAMNAYVSDNAGLVTYTLPATANFGDEYIIVGQGAGGWKLAQNAGQSIAFGTGNTTTGVTGYLASTNNTDSITLVCTIANTNFTVFGSVGNITYN